MIDRAGQLWKSKQTQTLRYVIRSEEGKWIDDSPCTWHEFVNLERGTYGRARERVDGTWDKRRDWKRIT